MQKESNMRTEIHSLQQVENREILHLQIYQMHKVDFQKRNKIL